MNAYKRARRTARLTAQEAAQRIGVSISSVFAWESGKTSPTAIHLRQMAQVYGSSADDLIKDERREDK